MSNELDKIIHDPMETQNLPEGAETDYNDIEDLFAEAFDIIPDSGFLNSIHEWWETKKFLTAAQYASLTKIANEE